jgi:hypothetical protein
MPIKDILHAIGELILIKPFADEISYGDDIKQHFTFHGDVTQNLVISSKLNLEPSIYPLNTSSPLSTLNAIIG